MPKVSILKQQREAKRAEKQTIKEIREIGPAGVFKVRDSFQNFAANLGVGTQNVSSFSTYGFNPISRIRILLEWIHRGNWLGGVAINAVAEDMTRAGVTLDGEMDPEDTAEIENAVVRMRIWDFIKDGVAWGRLYGGAIVVMLIDGQDYETALRVETIGKDDFKGIITLDRWMVEPSLQDLVSEPGPYMGLPKFYTITDAAPALRQTKVHYTRCIRLGGIKLPYNQAMMENLWDISVLERMYDRMIAFDSATQGAAQLIYKSYIRTYGVKDLRENIAAGGTSYANLKQYVQLMAEFAGIEGVTLIDAEDVVAADAGATTAIAGIDQVISQLGSQLSGAMGIPLVRMFGQSPAGFSTGDTDLRNYYDTISQHQRNVLYTAVMNIYRCIAASIGVKLPKNFNITFNPLWQLTDNDKIAIATQVGAFVNTLSEQGIMRVDQAMKELKKSSKITGYGDVFTAKDIKEAEKLPPPVPTSVEEAEVKAGTPPSKATPPVPGKATKATTDAASVSNKLFLEHGLDVVIENPGGTFRTGKDWRVLMPDDYGYIRRVPGVDGDAMDCFVGRHPESDKAFIFDTRDLKTGQFDEHKVFLGYLDRQAAEETFDMAYDSYGMARIMDVTEMSLPEFKEWCASPAVYSPAALQRTRDEAAGKTDRTGHKHGAETGQFVGTGSGPGVGKFAAGKGGREGKRQDGKTK